MAEDYFGIDLPMEGVKSTSLVYANNAEVVREPYACFCEEDDNGCHLELYPRSNGDICTATCNCISAACTKLMSVYRYMWVWGQRLRQGRSTETRRRLRVARAHCRRPDQSGRGESVLQRHVLPRGPRP